MEVIFEIIYEVYLELMLYIVPEQKASSKFYRGLSLAIAATVMFGVLALFIWGGVLLVDYNNSLGYIPITIGAVISIVQIILGLVLRSGDK